MTENSGAFGNHFRELETSKRCRGVERRTLSSLCDIQKHARHFCRKPDAVRKARTPWTHPHKP